MKWLNKPIYIKLTFLSAVVTGLMAHIYMMTNKLPNADEVGHINSYGQGIRVGRWFLEILGELADTLVGNYSMPFFNGFLFICLLGVAACQLVYIFEIKDSVCGIFMGAIFTVFPSVTNTMMFMFTAPFYGIAILMAVMAAKYILKPTLRSKAIGIILLILSSAVYQAYFPLCAAILVARLIQKAEEGVEIKAAIQYMLCCGVGASIYLLSVPLISKLSGVELVSYKNANQIGNVFMSQGLGKKLVMAYRAFINMMTVGFVGLTEYRIMRIIFMLMMGIAVALIGRRMYSSLRKGRGYGNAAWQAVLTIVYPLAVFSIYLSGAGKNDVYALMMFPAVMLFVLPIVLVYDCYGKVGRVLESICSYTLVICMSCIIVLYIRFANEYYLWMQMDFNQTKSYFTSIVTQIKECEDYEPEDEIVFVGDKFEDITITGTDNFQDISMEDGSGYLIHTYSYGDFIRYYCGFNGKISDRQDEVKEWEEVKKMPVYPKEGSISKIRGTIIVKVEE